MRDQEKLAIEIGYWCGYYSRAKKPKSPQALIEKIDRKLSSTSKEVDMEVEVARFKELEARLKRCQTVPTT